MDVAPQRDERAHRRRRLRDGLERNISLVIAKSAIALTPEDTDAVFEAGLAFGVRASADGWGQGLTILTSLRNLLPLLEPDERAHALHHGLAAVASDCDGMPPRHPVAPLPSQGRDADTVERWFRRCVEVRDAEGAERAIASAVRGGEAPGRVAAMLYAAATDHRYLTTGHVLDFTTKSLEALDHAGWEHAEDRARQPRPAVRRGRPCGGVEPVAQPGRPGRDPGRGICADAGGPGRPSTALDAAGRADRAAARRRAAGDRGRAAGRTACGRRAGGRRGRGHVRRRLAHRPLPREQRVHRLGHGAAHLHVRERGRAGTSSHGFGRAGARRLRRRDERVPRPLPEHAAGPAPER